MVHKKELPVRICVKPHACCITYINATLSWIAECWSINELRRQTLKAGSNPLVWTYSTISLRNLKKTGSPSYTQPSDNNSTSLSDSCTTTSLYYSYIAQWRLFPGPYAPSPFSCQLEGLVLRTAGGKKVNFRWNTLGRLWHTSM